MEWYEIEADQQRIQKFPVTTSPKKQQRGDSQTLDSRVGDEVPKLGGIIKNGEWAWLVQGCSLQIVSLRNGQTMSSFEFSSVQQFDQCSIKCVEEVFFNSSNIVLLAVYLEYLRSPGTSGPASGSFVAIYSADHSDVLSYIEFECHISCIRFVRPTTCRRTLLQNYDGCLAVGTEEGEVILMDLNLGQHLRRRNEKILSQNIFSTCRIIDYDTEMRQIHRIFAHCQKERLHFGLRIERASPPCAVLCILPIDVILGLAIGLEDGRLLLCEMADLQYYHTSTPEEAQLNASLVKLSFLEPLDDPRACFYVWAMHEHPHKGLYAVLHSFMYEQKSVDKCERRFFENFQNSTVRLHLTLESSPSAAVACQSIAKETLNEDDSNCLCALAWHVPKERKNKVLLFDLNQWYKEQMPYFVNWAKNPTYLAGYVLQGQEQSLHTYLYPNSIAHFNSMQRYEEHFYPNALSFDCVVLLPDQSRSYSWEGAQYRFINILRSSNASIFLEPNIFFKEVLHTRLLPQLMDFPQDAPFSMHAKYEVILSVALENNCYSLLRDCAKCWSDGSFLRNLAASTGLSLSTLTAWIWQRANAIKVRCNHLCKGLFDCDGYPLDQREKKELSFITHQLRMLAQLLQESIAFASNTMPPQIHEELSSKQAFLRIASDYQDVLLWLLNIGILPEGDQTADPVPSIERYRYQYQKLSAVYTERRAVLSKLCDKGVSPKTGSCRLLYIDAFIDQSFQSSALRDHWLENSGNGLYPPPSVEALLRVLLIADVKFEAKSAVLWYFLLDLLETARHDGQVDKNTIASLLKFPSVFKMPAALAKSVQAFWSLDHGRFQAAADEFTSPLTNLQTYPPWLLELLLEALLAQGASNLALRILESSPIMISPELKLKTFLANELVSEAFHFVRSKHDVALLELFFTCCLSSGRFSVIRDLALTEKEGQLVEHILRRSKTHGAESLHFVYLLQKSKYIEAVSYMDEISRRKNLRSHLNPHSVDTPNMVLSAYNTTMAPVTQGLTDVYFRIKHKIKKRDEENDSPVPLSCQLIRQNANNLLGGIYHSSALSAHFATYYCGGLEADKRNDDCNRDSTSLLNSKNAPFLRKPQTEVHHLDYVDSNPVSYPQVYRVCEKRQFEDSAEEDINESIQQANPVKRRRLLVRDAVEELSHFVRTKREQRLAEDGARTGHFDDENFLTQSPSMALHRRGSNLSAGEVQLRDRASTPRTEIHGILKNPTPERSERGGSQRRENNGEEERSLRFQLPLSDLDETKEEDLTAEDPPKQDATPKKTRTIQFTRSVSVDSDENESFVGEEFYSRSAPVPVDTKNVSHRTLSRNSTECFPGTPTPRRSLREVSEEPCASPSTTTEVETRRKEDAILKGRSFSSTTVHALSTSAEPHFSRHALHSTITPSLTPSAYPHFSGFQATSLGGSQVHEFAPQISSSQMTETHLKFSERSTVVGETFTGMGSHLNETVAVEESESYDESGPMEAAPIADTTLGMTAFTFSALEPPVAQEYYADLEAPLEESDVIEIVQETVETSVYEQEEYESGREALITGREGEDAPHDDVVVVLSSSDDESGAAEIIGDLDESSEDDTSSEEEDERVESTRSRSDRESTEAEVDASSSSAETSSNTSLNPSESESEINTSGAFMAHEWSVSTLGGMPTFAETNSREAQPNEEDEYENLTDGRDVSGELEVQADCTAPEERPESQAASRIIGDEAEMEMQGTPSITINLDSDNDVSEVVDGGEAEADVEMEEVLEIEEDSRLSALMQPPVEEVAVVLEDVVAIEEAEMPPEDRSNEAMEAATTSAAAGLGSAVSSASTLEGSLFLARTESAPIQSNEISETTNIYAVEEVSSNLQADGTTPRAQLVENEVHSTVYVGTSSSADDGSQTMDVSEPGGLQVESMGVPEADIGQGYQRRRSAGLDGSLASDNEADETFATADTSAGSRGLQLEDSITSTEVTAAAQQDEASAMDQSNSALGESDATGADDVLLPPDRSADIGLAEPSADNEAATSSRYAVVIRKDRLLVFQGVERGVAQSGPDTSMEIGLKASTDCDASIRSEEIQEILARHPEAEASPAMENDASVTAPAESMRVGDSDGNLSREDHPEEEPTATSLRDEKLPDESVDNEAPSSSHISIEDQGLQSRMDMGSEVESATAPPFGPSTSKEVSRDDASSETEEKVDPMPDTISDYVPPTLRSGKPWHESRKDSDKNEAESSTITSESAEKSPEDTKSKEHSAESSTSLDTEVELPTGSKLSEVNEDDVLNRSEELVTPDEEELPSETTDATDNEVASFTHSSIGDASLQSVVSSKPTEDKSSTATTMDVDPDTSVDASLVETEEVPSTLRSGKIFHHSPEASGAKKASGSAHSSPEEKDGKKSMATAPIAMATLPDTSEEAMEVAENRGDDASIKSVELFNLAHRGRVSAEPHSSKEPPQASMENEASSQRDVTEGRNVDTGDASIRAVEPTPETTSAQSPDGKPASQGIEVSPANLHLVESTSQNRGKRGISVPAQTKADNEGFRSNSPPFKRALRAASLQAVDADAGGDSLELEAIRRLRQKRGRSFTPEASTPPVKGDRGESFSPAGGRPKTPARRRSVLWDAIAEDGAIPDSPSSRTRSRMRLSSMDSDLNASIASVEQKRARRNSNASNASDSQTPKKSTERTPSEDSETPRSLRGRSTRKSISGATAEDEEKAKEDDGTVADKPSEESEQPTTSYSDSRRLTRGQLAILDRSAALMTTAHAHLPQSPVQKRISQRRTSRSTAAGTGESDDAQSVASDTSGVSKKRVRKRRGSQSETGPADDAISVASSMESERRTRSKKRASPVALAVIPEAETEDAVIPKKRGRAKPIQK